MGREVVLAIRRRSNGVFQFAVAGNERMLKPSQLFCLRRGGGGKRRERRRSGVWRWIIVLLDR